MGKFIVFACRLALPDARTNCLGRTKPEQEAPAGRSENLIALEVDLPPHQSGKAEDARSKQNQRSRLGRRRGAEVEFKALGIAHIRSVAQEGVILAKPCQASGIGIDKPEALISRVQG